MKRISALLIAFVFLFTFIACGTSDKAASPGTTAAQAGTTAAATTARSTTAGTQAPKDIGSGDTDVKITSFHRVESAFVLASVASEIDYTYEVKDPEGNVKVNNYSFRVLEEKKVDGEKAYLVSFNVNIDGREDEMELLIVEKDIVEAVIDGEKKTGNALLPLMITLNTYMQPYIVHLVWSEIISKPPMQTVYRWKLESEDTKKISFSKGPMELLCLEYEVADNKLYFEIASIDGKNMFINTSTSKEGTFYELTTTHFVANKD